MKRYKKKYKIEYTNYEKEILFYTRATFIATVIIGLISITLALIK